MKTEKEVIKYCLQCGYRWTEDCDFCPCCDNTKIGYEE